jgi:dihydroorotate dehydrogenase (NAD+) catalytic subunit
MTAAGTAGHGAELAPYGNLGALGAHVVKSLSVQPWPGNPAPRVHAVGTGMLNAVGLQGPGLAAWARDDLPKLSGVRVVVSIWGRSVEEFAAAAALVGELPDHVVACEVNLSCPNLSGKAIFAHDVDASHAVVSAVVAAAHRPVWAKLSPNTDRNAAVAGAVAAAGAEAVTLTNTLIGLAVDPVSRTPLIANTTAGYSGEPLHPVALRVVHEVHTAHPDLPIIGVGGVRNAASAAAMLIAGASAVQVGTATFADPRAPWQVLEELVSFCAEQGVPAVSDLVGTLRTR